MRSKTTIATPPGATIKEQLVNRGMSQKEFAARMETSEKHISNLINGEVKLTSDMAMRLEMVLGVPARFWSNLESIYREKLEKARAENEMDEDLELLKNIPYNEMVKNNWIESTRKPKERVFHLRKFFEVVRLGLLFDSPSLGVIYRKLGENEKNDYALIAWAQKAKLEARNIEVSPINIEKLEKIIPSIREMTVQRPECFCHLLCEKLRECGIALVFLPHIRGTFLHGASFYDGPKIVIGMTVRGKDADRFWFSFFHEIGHIMLGHLNQIDGTSAEDEAAADSFARNILIPDEKFKSFLSRSLFTSESILDFAKGVGIDPGIVVGRLQKEGKIPFNRYNSLKTKYELTA